MRPGLTLFIDADDTLWENNIYFDSVIDRTATRLTEYGVSTERTREALLAIERQRTRAHGYGSLNFGASLEVLCEHVGIGESLDQLRPFLRAEIAALRRKRLELLPDVPDTLAYLRRRHRLVLFTKGNHDEQWDKVVRSGLRDLFHQVDVVREKDQAAYADAARRLGVAARTRLDDRQQPEVRHHARARRRLRRRVRAARRAPGPSNSPTCPRRTTPASCRSSGSGSSGTFSEP